MSLPGMVYRLVAECTVAKGDNKIREERPEIWAFTAGDSAMDWDSETVMNLQMLAAVFARDVNGKKGKDPKKRDRKIGLLMDGRYSNYLCFQKGSAKIQELQIMCVETGSGAAKTVMKVHAYDLLIERNQGLVPDSVSMIKQNAKEGSFTRVNWENAAWVVLSLQNDGAGFQLLGDEQDKENLNEVREAFKFHGKSK